MFTEKEDDKNMIVSFTLDLLQHRTEWTDKISEYFEVVCIAKDLSVSFTYYWYPSEYKAITLRNLFVSQSYRYKGIASTVLKDLKFHCDKYKMNLNLWVDSNNLSLISMYLRRGFTIITVTNEHTSLQYKGV